MGPQDQTLITLINLARKIPKVSLLSLSLLLSVYVRPEVLGGYFLACAAQVGKEPRAVLGNARKRLSFVTLTPSELPRQNDLDVHVSELQSENRDTKHVQSAGLGGVCLPTLPRKAGSKTSPLGDVRRDDALAVRPWA